MQVLIDGLPRLTEQDVIQLGLQGVFFERKTDMHIEMKGLPSFETLRAPSASTPSLPSSQKRKSP